MDKNQILVIAAVLVAVSIRLYKYYAKKNKVNQGGGTLPSSPTSFPSSVKDDEYEPYSKK
jgi:Tfp pilus assembly major pilin PilA